MIDRKMLELRVRDLADRNVSLAKKMKDLEEENNKLKEQNNRLYNRLYRVEPTKPIQSIKRDFIYQEKKQLKRLNNDWGSNSGL